MKTRLDIDTYFIYRGYTVLLGFKFFSRSIGTCYTIKMDTFRSKILTVVFMEIVPYSGYFDLNGISLLIITSKYCGLNNNDFGV